MLDDQGSTSTTTTTSSSSSSTPDDDVREIHALSSPSQHPSASSASRPPPRGRDSWGAASRSSSLSLATDVDFSSMSREFNALVVAGSTLQEPSSSGSSVPHGTDPAAAATMGRIGEDELVLEETNPLAIVPDSNPIPSPRRASSVPGSAGYTDQSSSSLQTSAAVEEVSVHRVKKEEVESKIAARQTAEIAKINNRFKRQDVVINGWESEQVEKATSWLRKVERKLDEQRARAMEKMQNDVAKARRKAEEKRASAEAKRGTKVAKVLELSNLFRAVGRAPSKRSFF